MQNGQSLRCLVEKWFGGTAGRGIRLTRSGLGRPYEARCVRVVTTVAGRELAIFFFRHGDGSWCVSPPRDRRAVWGEGV